MRLIIAKRHSSSIVINLFRQESLKAQDIIRCAGLQIQLIEKESAGDAVEPSLMTVTNQALVEARSQIKQMIDEQAMLRREVGLAQESEARAKRLRDEAQDEVERLHDVIAKLGQDKESLAAKVEELGKELRERLATKTDPRTDELTAKLSEAQKQVEKHKVRIAELEEKDAARVASEGPLRKEIDRLADILKKRDQRELELQAAVKPALIRIAELTRELENTRIELAHSQADLEDIKKALLGKR